MASRNGVEVDAGRWLASKVGEGLRVVDGLGVAALGVGHGGFGELGFEGEDVVGVGGGLLRAFRRRG